MKTIYPPYAVENIAIWKNPDVQIWSQYVMEPSDLLISEEGVWHPNFASVSQSEVADFI